MRHVTQHCQMGQGVAHRSLVEDVAGAVGQAAEVVVEEQTVPTLELRDVQRMVDIILADVHAVSLHLRSVHVHHAAIAHCITSIHELIVIDHLHRIPPAAGIEGLARRVVQQVAAEAGAGP